MLDHCRGRRLAPVAVFFALHWQSQWHTSQIRAATMTIGPFDHFAALHSASAITAKAVPACVMKCLLSLCRLRLNQRPLSR